MVEPLGLDTPAPRFRWLLRSVGRAQLQTAYQILVASDPEKLRSNIGDKWDSGKVSSDNSVEIPYQGKAPASGERLHWKVRIWDQMGRASAYSDPAWFEMGLLREHDWQAKWIAADAGISSPLIRKLFVADGAIRRARVYVSGLGYYELSLNGRKVGDRVLEPASTLYSAPPEQAVRSRVLYATYDVTDAVRAGPNVVGVMLGHGWYSSEATTKDVLFRRIPYGDRPRLIMRLVIDYVDGRTASIVTDQTWRTSAGPVTYNDLANGEEYDARLEQPGWNTPQFNDANWKQASLAEAPSGRLVAQRLPPAKVMETLPVKQVLQPKSPELFEGARIYDFGQNLSGWVRIIVSGPRGAKLVLRHATRIHPEDDTLDTRSNTSENWEARQRDVYILKGEKAEIWEPRFTLHGFRYVEIRDFEGRVSIDKVEARYVRSAVDVAGTFDSSSTLLNRIHQNLQHTFKMSFQGIPQDATERGERVAYLGDMGFVAEDYLMGFDVASFLEKWLDDVADSQNAEGNISTALPPHNGFRKYSLWPSWHAGYPRLVWGLYQFYGDKGVLEAHYPALTRLANLMTTAANGGLLDGEPLGDHMEPQKTGYSSFASLHTSPVLTANASYYYILRTVGKIAEALGRKPEASAYARRAAAVRAAFIRRFLPPGGKTVGTGSQAANAVALNLDLVPSDRNDDILGSLVEDVTVKQDMHVTTGIIGTDALIDALSRYGRRDLLFGLLNRTSHPSLGHQVELGATTVCESYECAPWLSQSMKMFASWYRVFYRDLAGITPASPGFRHILIRPPLIEGLDHVSASLQTARGQVAVEWAKEADAVGLKVDVPPGVEAVLEMPRPAWPLMRVREGNSIIWTGNKFTPGTNGIFNVALDKALVRIRMGSGTYNFLFDGARQ